MYADQGAVGFQFSIGDAVAWHYERHRGVRRRAFQFSIGDARDLGFTTLPKLFDEFQFSIGDAAWATSVYTDIDKKSFNSLLEMLFTISDAREDVPLEPGFNSLLEMPTHKLIDAVQTGIKLDGFNSLLEMRRRRTSGARRRRQPRPVSILYWRCSIKATTARAAVNSCSFNSLLEMLSFVEF